MNLEELVLTIEQAKYLQKLGLDMSDAAFTWHTNLYTKDTHLGTGYLGRKRSVYTYTLQEVLGKLPKEIEVNGSFYDLVDKSDEGLGYAELTYGNGWNDEPYGMLDYHVCFDSVDSLRNAYELLCWVIANGYLKEDKNDVK